MMINWSAETREILGSGFKSQWPHFTYKTIFKKLFNPTIQTKRFFKHIIDDLYITLKNNSGNIEDYIKIKKLINYFKGTWVNILSGNR